MKEAGFKNESHKLTKLRPYTFPGPRTWWSWKRHWICHILMYSCTHVLIYSCTFTRCFRVRVVSARVGWK